MRSRSRSPIWRRRHQSLKKEDADHEQVTEITEALEQTFSQQTKLLKQLHSAIKQQISASFSCAAEDEYLATGKLAQVPLAADVLSDLMPTVDDSARFIAKGATGQLLSGSDGSSARSAPRRQRLVTVSFNLGDTAAAYEASTASAYPPSAIPSPRTADHSSSIHFA